MSKFSLPSTGTILGFVAVIISLGSAGYAASSFVTIVDPTTNSRAKVTGGRLEVSVDETVTTRAATPGTFFHALKSVSTGCVTLASPPAGKALIIQQVRANIYQNPTPNSGNWIAFFLGPNCTDPVVASLNPATLGVTVIPLGPGVAIPQGKALSVKTFNSVLGEAYADGFTVPAAQVPASGDVMAQSEDALRQLQRARRQ